MAFVSKEWLARIVPHPGRRKLTNVLDNTEVTYDVERAEGEASQEGDSLSAANMNDLEERIGNAFTEVNKNLPDGIYGKLLWANTNVGSSFLSQTVNLADNDCDVFEIWYNNGKGINNSHGTDCIKVYKNGTGMQMNYISSYETSPFSVKREFSSTQNSLVFLNAYVNGTSDNSYLIPIRVIGYKESIL